MLPPLFSIISLGCPRNLVDSQAIAAEFIREGYALTDDLEKADVIIVNTCGFIEDAKTESISEILELEDLKKAHPNKRIIIAGCLAQRYSNDLKKLFRWAEVRGCIDANAIPSMDYPFLHYGSYAYIKACEGCLSRCSFCAIPMIKGPLVSRPMESIIEEAQYIESCGVKELIVIGQETNAYGIDIYGGPKLAGLLRRIVEHTGIPWIRLLYLHPNLVDGELLELIQSEKRILPYFDISIQHIDDRILKAMNRGYSSKDIWRLIERIRDKTPHAAIRSSILVGFPGESARTIGALCRFLEEAELDNVGVFGYSREEGTAAYDMRPQLRKETKGRYIEEVMLCQQEVSLKKNSGWVGKEITAIIEGFDEKESRYIARTYRNAPEIDGVVYVASDRPLELSAFQKVSITKAGPYDLFGKV